MNVKRWLGVAALLIAVGLCTLAYTVPGPTVTQTKLAVTDSLRVNRTTEMVGNVNVSAGKLVVRDSLRVTGPARFASTVTLDVGSITSGTDLSTSGFGVIEDSLRVGTSSQSSPAVISGALTVWGKAVIDDSLRVTGPSRFASACTFDVPPTFSDLITTGKGVAEDSLRVGTSSQAASLIVSGTATVYGASTFNGAATFNGGTNFGSGGTIIGDTLRANLSLFVGGARITKIIQGTFTHDFASVSAASTLDETQAVAETGLDAASNWRVFITPQADMSAGIDISYARVSADNTLKIRIQNTCGAAVDNASMTFAYFAIK